MYLRINQEVSIHNPYSKVRIFGVNEFSNDYATLVPIIVETIFLIGRIVNHPGRVSPGKGMRGVRDHLVPVEVAVVAKDDKSNTTGRTS